MIKENARNTAKGARTAKPSEQCACSQGEKSGLKIWSDSKIKKGEGYLKESQVSPGKDAADFCLSYIYFVEVGGARSEGGIPFLLFRRMLPFSEMNYSPFHILQIVLQAGFCCCSDSDVLVLQTPPQLEFSPESDLKESNDFPL